MLAYQSACNRYYTKLAGIWRGPLLELEEAEAMISGSCSYDPIPSLGYHHRKCPLMKRLHSCKDVI